MTMNDRGHEPKMTSTKLPPSPTEICELCLGIICTIDEHMNDLCDKLFIAGTQLEAESPDMPPSFDSQNGGEAK